MAEYYDKQGALPRGENGETMDEREAMRLRGKPLTCQKQEASAENDPLSALAPFIRAYSSGGGH